MDEFLEGLRAGLGVAFAIGAAASVVLAGWQLQEARGGRRAGARQHARDALITALVCGGLAVELLIAAVLAL